MKRALKAIAFNAIIAALLVAGCFTARKAP